MIQITDKNGICFALCTPSMVDIAESISNGKYLLKPVLERTIEKINNCLAEFEESKSLTDKKNYEVNFSVDFDFSVNSISYSWYKRKWYKWIKNKELIKQQKELLHSEWIYVNQELLNIKPLPDKGFVLFFRFPNKLSFRKIIYPAMMKIFREYSTKPGKAFNFNVREAVDDSQFLTTSKPKYDWDGTCFKLVKPEKKAKKNANKNN